MAIEVQIAVPEDSLLLTQVGHYAFANDVLAMRDIHYDGATAEQREEYWAWRSGRMHTRLQQKTVHCFKAVDTENGRIAGFSIIIEPRSASEAEAAGQKENELPVPAIVSPTFGETAKLLDEARRKYLGDRTDFWYLSAMAVHPDYQRRGVGQALLRADLALADQAGLDTYLESRPPAVRLYQSQSFREIGHLQDPEDGEVHPVMLRKAKT